MRARDLAEPFPTVSVNEDVLSFIIGGRVLGAVTVSRLPGHLLPA